MYVKTSAKVVGVGALIGMPAMAAYHTITEAKAEDTEAEFRVGRAPYRPDALAVDVLLVVLAMPPGNGNPGRGV